jgi:hypothetical protein
LTTTSSCSSGLFGQQNTVESLGRSSAWQTSLDAQSQHSHALHWIVNNYWRHKAGHQWHQHQHGHHGARRLYTRRAFNRHSDQSPMWTSLSLKASPLIYPCIPYIRVSPRIQFTCMTQGSV